MEGIFFAFAYSDRTIEFFGLGFFFSRNTFHLFIFKTTSPDGGINKGRPRLFCHHTCCEKSIVKPLKSAVRINQVPLWLQPCWMPWRWRKKDIALFNSRLSFLLLRKIKKNKNLFSCKIGFCSPHLPSCFD